MASFCRANAERLAEPLRAVSYTHLDVYKRQREQSARGLRLGENDTWQAAVALRFALTIITDGADFEKVPLIKRRN